MNEEKEVKHYCGGLWHSDPTFHALSERCPACDSTWHPLTWMAPPPKEYIEGKTGKLVVKK